MTCQYCAQPLADGSQFCPKCGSKVGTPGATPPPTGASTPPPFSGAPTTSGMAIGSLICGFFFWFLPTSIIAVVLGHMSLSQIRKSAGRLTGQGMAIAGLVLGYMGIAFIPFILIIAAIAIPNILRSRMAANEASAVAAMRNYNTAAGYYFSRCPEKGFPESAANLGPNEDGSGAGDCVHANLLQKPMALPKSVKSGYVFVYQAMGRDSQGRTTAYAISADPLQPGASGIRHFYTDDSGLIRLESGHPATADSPPLQ
jgi:type IV pilus assembly protein PilA